MLILYLFFGIVLLGCLLYAATQLYRLRRCNATEDIVLLEILRNVSAYILLIDKDLNVVRTNYYQISGRKEQIKNPKVGNLLMCRNGEDAGLCGTHDLCAICPVRVAILKSFHTHKSFSDLEAEMTLYLEPQHTSEKSCSFSISGRYLKIGGKFRLLLTVHDISAQKRIRQELEEARQRAEESDRMKSQFLANTSHELRTPLNAIVGFSELLASSETTPEERAAYMQIIRDNNKMLIQLVNDTLDLSKIEAGTLEYQIADTELNSTMHELYEVFRQRIAIGTPVELIFERKYDSCTIRTDHHRLTQVLSNLLSNAIKFTKSGSIRFGYEKQANGVLFYTIDTGLGMSEEQQASIFKRFSKLDTFKQGVGIGLAISKSIVETLGGYIGVESQPNKGSRFWFILPYTYAEEVTKRGADPILKHD